MKKHSKVIIVVTLIVILMIMSLAIYCNYTTPNTVELVESKDNIESSEPKKEVQSDDISLKLNNSIYDTYLYIGIKSNDNLSNYYSNTYNIYVNGTQIEHDYQNLYEEEFGYCIDVNEYEDKLLSIKVEKVKERDEVEGVYERDGMLSFIYDAYSRRNSTRAYLSPILM